MGHPLENKKYYTVEEYLQHEETSEFRSEYYKGELYPLMATTKQHNEIVLNIATKLRQHFRPKGCKVFSENVKVEVIKDVYYPYPDVVLSCDANDDDELLVKMPMLIVEVLSKSTSDHDKNFKWEHYRKIPTLRYYLLVSQSKASVECFARTSNIAIWTFQEFDDLSDIIQFPAFDFSISLSEIYEFIAF